MTRDTADLLKLTGVIAAALGGIFLLHRGRIAEGDRLLHFDFTRMPEDIDKVVDLSGNNNHGTLESPSGMAPVWADAGLVLTGGNYVLVENDVFRNMDYLMGGAIRVVFRVPYMQHMKGLVGYDDARPLLYFHDGRLAVAWAPCYPVIVSPDILEPGKWYDVLISWQAPLLELYTNGESTGGIILADMPGGVGSRRLTIGTDSISYGATEITLKSLTVYGRKVSP